MGQQQLNALVAATRLMLKAYEDERQAVYECSAGPDGAIDDLEVQLLVSIMDDTIERVTDALAPFTIMGSPSAPSRLEAGRPVGRTKAARR